MGKILVKRDHYTRAEKRSDAIIHVAGLVLALVGVSVLITLSIVWRDEPSVRIGTAVYSICLLAMLGASASYHMTPWQEWKSFLRRLDQSAIYIKIAGTYTPFIILAGPGAMPLLVGIWAAAFAGALLKMAAPDRFVPLALALYLGMGWVAVVAGGEMISALTPQAFTLMLIGGVIYTLGVVFFLWEQLPFHTTIWHAMVLVATVIFYIAVLIEVADRPLS